VYAFGSRDLFYCVAVRLMAFLVVKGNTGAMRIERGFPAGADCFGRGFPLCEP